MKLFSIFLLGTLPLFVSCSDEPSRTTSQETVNNEMPVTNKQDKNYFAAKKIYIKGCKADTEADKDLCNCQFEVVHYNLSKSIGKKWYKNINLKDSDKYDYAGQQAIELCKKFVQ